MSDISAAGELNLLGDRVLETAKKNGFWSSPQTVHACIPTKLALIHDEVSEALRLDREPLGIVKQSGVRVLTDTEIELREKFNEELADIIIRVLDLARGLDLDIGTKVVQKIKVNEERPFRHGKRY